MEMMAGHCTVVVLKDTWGARVSSDSRVVEGSEEEVWEVSGVTCELGVFGIKTPVTVCTPFCQPYLHSTGKECFVGTMGTGQSAEVHVIWGLPVLLG